MSGTWTNRETCTGWPCTRSVRLNLWLGADNLIRHAGHVKAAADGEVNDPDAALHALAELRRHLEYYEGNAREWNRRALADGHPLARKG